MRLKYPQIAVGALASSAPILQFDNIVPPETFYDLVSNDFKVCKTVTVFILSLLIFGGRFHLKCFLCYNNNSFFISL